MSQIMEHYENQNLVPAHQSAYHKFHSCETLLMHLINDILWTMEHGKIMGVVFLDLSAAFDTVDHEILLSVLEKKYYIAGNVLKWISTYLQPRNFKVCMDDKYSNPKDLQFSVPQGSCNGLMYSTYTAEQYLNAYLKM